MKRKPNPIYGREYLKNPQPSTLFADVYRELDAKATLLGDRPQNHDMGTLADQVVGAENNNIFFSR